MKIVIAYALAGIGHKRAAEALYLALEEERPHRHEIYFLDALDLTNPVFRWLYPRVYLWLVTYLPWLWGWMYFLLDHPFIAHLIGPLRHGGNRLNATRLRQYLTALKPDVIIATHFFPADVVASLRQEGRLHSRLITVVTDYYLHSFWILPAVNTYVVASEETKADLEWRGVSPERVRVSSIPVVPAFYQQDEHPLILEQLGLVPGRLTALVVSGGFGLGPMGRIVRQVLALPEPYGSRLQLIVVCGDNPRLYRAMKRLTRATHLPIHVLGFTQRMPQLMRLADVVITKPGGLTVAEALALRKPLITFAPIWGQETRNVRWLTCHHVALAAERPRQIADYIRRLVDDPALLQEMRERMAGVANPHAAQDIANWVLHEGATVA